jgi:hypothetical protein
MTINEIIADFEIHGYSVDMDGVVYFNGRGGCQCQNSRECDRHCDRLRSELLLRIAELDHIKQWGGEKFHKHQQNAYTTNAILQHKKDRP